MSAATADRSTSFFGTVLMMGLLVSAGTTIYAGTLLTSESDGFVEDGTDATSKRFAGVAAASFDNSGSATDGQDEDGEEAELEVYTRGVFRFAASGLAAEDVGKAVYLLDNQTVVLSGHASLDYHIYVGRIAKYISASECLVELDTYGVDPNLHDGMIEVAGVNAAAIDLASNAFATNRGGTGVYVKAVEAVEAIVTATGAPATVYRKVVTTHWTLASGVITTVGDESANTLRISGKFVVKQA